MFTKDTAKEFGKKGGINSGRSATGAGNFRKYSAIVKKLSDLTINPTEEQKQIFELIGVKADAKISVFMGVFSTVVYKAMAGDFNYTKLYFELLGMTPNAKKLIADAYKAEVEAQKIKENELVIENAQEVKAEIVSVEEMRREAISLLGGENEPSD